MKHLLALILPALLLAGVTAPAADPMTVALNGVDLAALPEAQRRTLTEALADLDEVLAGRPPRFAVVDEDAPVPADGGTSFYLGRGYTLTVVRSLSSLGDPHGRAYGPVVTFDANLAPGNTDTFSHVTFHSRDAFRELRDRRQ